jgi:hypothetical protein
MPSSAQVNKVSLQLLGCACMLLASKYEEVATRSVEDFVYVSDRAYSNQQICAVRVVVSRVSLKCAELDARTPRCVAWRRGTVLGKAL